MAQGRPLALTPRVHEQTMSSRLKIRLGIFIRACMGYYDRIQELTWILGA